MNLKSLVYFSLFSLTALNTNAQNASDELLKINNQPFTVGEFERIYTKNLDLIKDDQQKDLDNYLDLFILYKLKVAKAYDLGLDKEKTHVNEFNSHRKQLAEQYLTNEETLEKLAKEAYDRSNYEINASHIIFLADEFVTPADTLKAYNKAIEVRNQILNGLDFNEAAIQFSEDPSAKTNKGNLGYFTALRMVYPFETAAYNTPKGEVSEPIRSQFGYHLIKVNDKRARHGKREIAHIVIEDKDPGFIDSNKLIIDEVYKSLQKGESFEELALKYSDDKTTNHKGGVFSHYEQGSSNINGLDEAVYPLTAINEYSKPFKSQYGWHIVKLVSTEDLPSYKDRKDFFLRKVKSDNRSRIIDKKLTDHLKKKYNFKINEKNYKVLIASIEKNITDNDWKTKLKSDSAIANYADQKVTGESFINYIENNNINLAAIDPIENGINYCFNDFISKEIKDYYNNNLEIEFPEFKHTIQEFKEGLILYDLMNNEIWNKVKNDSIGYTNFYNSNPDKFHQEEMIVGKIYETNNKSEIKEVLNKLKSNSNELDLSSDKILIKKGRFTKGDSRLPKDYVLKTGISDILTQNNKYFIVVADEYINTGIIPLEEARENLIYEYQQEFENKWLNDLKKDAKIEINNKTLNQLKTKYQQK